MSKMPPWNELYAQTRKARNLPPITEDFTHLCFDPGHTTGWALFIGGQFAEAGQIDTHTIEIATPNILNLFVGYDPSIVIYEDYRVYKWRQKHHVGSELMTTQVIGCIKTVAQIQFPIPDIITQPAHVAKKFCLDSRLKEWGFYQIAEKHANDAVRHGCYAILFGPLQAKDRKNKPAKTVG